MISMRMMVLLKPAILVAVGAMMGWASQVSAASPQVDQVVVAIESTVVMGHEDLSSDIAQSIPVLMRIAISSQTIVAVDKLSAPNQKFDFIVSTKLLALRGAMQLSAQVRRVDTDETVEISPMYIDEAEILSKIQNFGNLVRKTVTDLNRFVPVTRIAVGCFVAVDEKPSETIRKIVDSLPNFLTYYLAREKADADIEWVGLNRDCSEVDAALATDLSVAAFISADIQSIEQDVTIYPEIYVAAGAYRLNITPPIKGSTNDFLDVVQRLAKRIHSFVYAVRLADGSWTGPDTWNTRELDIVYADARAACDEGEIELCIEKARRAKDTRQGSADFLKLLGEALYKHGDYQDAASELEQAAIIAPGDDDIFRLLGQTYAAQGRYKNAVSTYQRLSTKGSADYVALGDFSMLQSDATHALDYYKQSIDGQNAPEEQAETYSKLGRAETELGLTDQAIEHFEIAVGLVPHDEAARLNFALARITRADIATHFKPVPDDIKQSIDDYRIADELLGTLSKEYWPLTYTTYVRESMKLNQAELLILNGDYRKAAELMQALLVNADQVDIEHLPMAIFFLAVTRSVTEQSIDIEIEQLKDSMRSPELSINWDFSIFDHWLETDIDLTAQSRHQINRLQEHVK